MKYTLLPLFHLLGGTVYAIIRSSTVVGIL